MSFFSALPTDPESIRQLIERISKYEKDREEHYAAIGKVASSWASFEHILNMQTLVLGNIPQYPGLCLCANIMGYNKITAFASLAGHIGLRKETQRMLRDFMEDARSLSEKRNRFVHDPWMLLHAAEHATRLEVTARGTLRTELLPMPTDDVLKLAQDIETLQTRFMELVGRIDEERPESSPDTVQSEPPA